MHKFVIQTGTDEDLRTALTSFAVEKGWAIQSIFTQSYSLEEIFHNLTLHDPAAEAIDEDEETAGLEADDIEPEELEEDAQDMDEPETQNEEEVDQ